MTKTLVTALITVLITSCSTEHQSGDPAPGSAKGVWSADRIIDIHGHTGTFRGYDLSTQTLWSNIDSFGIRMVFISNVDGANLPGTTLNLDARSANEATLNVIVAYPDRLRGIAWARPSDGSPADVEPFLQDRRLDGPDPRTFVAIKLHPVMNQFPADAPTVDPYFELAQKYDVPVVYHSDKPGTNADPALIYAAAKRHPDVPVILYHMVFFGPHDAAIRVVEDALQNGDANLYLETGQADPDAVLDAITRVGSDRVMFGTDATYYGTEHYRKYETLISMLRSRLSAGDFQKVMHGNALRVFNFPETTE